jgi:hypothetical protein
MVVVVHKISFQVERGLEGSILVGHHVKRCKDHVKTGKEAGLAGRAALPFAIIGA